MSFAEFKKSLLALKNTLDQLAKDKLDFTITDPAPGVYKYDQMRQLSLKKSVGFQIEQLNKHAASLQDAMQGFGLTKAMKLVNDLDTYHHTNNVKQMALAIDQIADLIADAEEIMPMQGKMTEVPSKIPTEIKEELVADLHEIEKTFQTGCYRSCVILCGRILEAVLHRKYYDVTGQDLLEKAPGIGLGKIIAKLKEKEVAIDPGLTQQIHLINQVRIFSVHAKQEAFYPSKEQAHGTILLTMDVLKKFYGK